MASYASITSGRKILVVVGDFVESNQLISPFQFFQTIGYQVHVISPDKQQGHKVITTLHVFEDYSSYTEKIDQAFELNFNSSAIDVNSYDALYLPGGRAAEHLRLNPQVLDIARHFASTNKPIVAVGHGVLILVSAGVLDGRRVTSYVTCVPSLTTANATYVEVAPRDIVIDDNLITASSWQANHRICATLIAKLGTQIIHRTIDEQSEARVKDEGRRKQEESKKP